MHIAILNGPNLNLLGKREPELYGSEDFESYRNKLQHAYPQLNLTYHQSNHEGELLDLLHKNATEASGIILNGGAFTHTSIALGDAVAALSVPVVEVHISNVYQRALFRHQSYISPHAQGVIVGFGLDGYRLAVEHLLHR